VARFAQTHEIVIIMRSAFGQGNDMVYFLCRSQPVILKTFLAQRMCLYIPVPYAFPRPAVTFAVLGIALVFVVLFVRQLLMFFAVPSVGKSRTSRVRARPLWLFWHLSTSFGKKKSHYRMRSPAMACVYTISASIS